MGTACATVLEPATDEFCIGRMVSEIGLLKMGVASDLRAARTRMKELTGSWPGDYVVFHRNTGRVVAKASSEFQRGWPCPGK